VNFWTVSASALSL